MAVVRRAARVTDRRDGHRRSRLTPDLAGQRAVVAEHELAPGAEIGGAPAARAGQPGGARRAAGPHPLALDGAEHALAAGDTATFDSDLPHRISNPGESPAVFLSVVTAGLRRA